MKKIAHGLSVVGLGLGALGALGNAAADDSAEARSRANVVTELNAARSSGELAAWVGEDSGSFFLSRQGGSSMVSRGQVVADVMAARRSGGLEWMYGEDSGSFVLSGTPAAAGARYAGPDADETDRSARIARAK